MDILTSENIEAKIAVVELQIEAKILEMHRAQLANERELTILLLSTVKRLRKKRLLLQEELEECKMVWRM